MEQISVSELLERNSKINNIRIEINWNKPSNS